MMLAVAANDAIEIADLSAAVRRPAEEFIIIGCQAPGRRSLHQQAKVAPGAFLNGAEVTVLDIETADQHATFVGQRQLLMTTNEVAPAIGWVEAAKLQTPVDKGREIAVRHMGAEAVDQQRHCNAAVDGAAHCCVDQSAGTIVAVDIIEQPNALLSAIN